MWRSEQKTSFSGIIVAKDTTGTYFLLYFQQLTT
jgi:hypothetical protein